VGSEGTLGLGGGLGGWSHRGGSPGELPGGALAAPCIAPREGQPPEPLGTRRGSVLAQHPQVPGRSRGLPGTLGTGASSRAGGEVRRCRCFPAGNRAARRAADVQTAKAALPQGTGQDQPFPTSPRFCAAAGRSQKPSVPRTVSQGHRHPAPPRPRAPSPGSSQGLCKQGGLSGTGARAAADPRPAARPLAPASGTLVGFVPLGLGLLPPLCEEAFLVVAFALELAVRGQVPRLRPLAAVHLHLQQGRARGGSGARRPRPQPLLQGWIGGWTPPPRGTHSTHPHHPAPQKHPAAPRTGVYLVVSLQVLPGEVQHLLLGGRPVVVARGFLGTGRERGPRQLLRRRHGCGTGRARGVSPAGARSPRPAGASARGGSGSRPGSAASRRRPGRRACSWRRCAPRPARRSLRGAAPGDVGGDTPPRGPQHPGGTAPCSRRHSRL